MKTRYYILTGLIAYLFFTLGNVPAAKVIPLIESATPIPAKLYGVYGSLWNGGADKAIIKGQPPVEDLQWSINPASLLLAHVSGEAKASIKQQNIIGNFSISPGGTVSASDVRARIDAAVLQELVSLPVGELGGTFNINIQSLEFNAEGFPDVTADIKWKNAQLTLLETVKLGDINLSLKPGEQDQLLAKINNKKGELSIQGDGEVNHKKMYAINVSITPQDTASDNVKQSLKMFTRRQANGSYLLKRKGNLQEFGL